MSRGRHPIFALWCHPRSRSTPLERAMIERGDLEVLHEPFSYLYYVHRRRSTAAHLDEDPSQPRSYAEIRAHILATAARGPVLIKDMAYHCLAELAADEELLRRMRHAFLIRDPALSIGSLHALAPDCSLEEVGLEQLCRLHRRVVGLTGVEPPVVDAEALVRRPERSFGRLCEALGLPVIDRALTWNRGHRPEWDSWKVWHREVAASSGVHERRRRYSVTVDNDPTLRRLYEHHLPFYLELRARVRDTGR